MIGRSVAPAVLGLALVGCGGGSVTGPTVTPTDPTPEAPAWRSDREDALNWYLGHLEPGTWLSAPGTTARVAVAWEGDRNTGRFMIDVHDGRPPIGHEYQHFRYDPQWIYLVEDWAYAGPGRDRCVSTSWSEFRLVPRRLDASSGSVANSDNRITWWRYGCSLDRVNRYPTYVDWDFDGENLTTIFATGGGNPMREIAVMDWERGFWRWEYWRDGEASPRHAAVLTEVVLGPEAQMGESCSF